MRGNIWLHAEKGRVVITDLGEYPRLHRVYNRGPGDILMLTSKVRLAAGCTYDIYTPTLSAELAPDNPYHVGLVEWEYLAQ